MACDRYMPEPDGLSCGRLGSVVDHRHRALEQLAVALGADFRHLVVDIYDRERTRGPERTLDPGPVPESPTTTPMHRSLPVVSVSVHSPREVD